jgi:hypothetical protein
MLTLAFAVVNGRTDSAPRRGAAGVARARMSSDVTGLLRAAGAQRLTGGPFRFSAGILTEKQ